MSLDIFSFILGPISNNTYLLADTSSRQAVVIDPSFDPQPVLAAVRANDLTLTAIWVTHAHFDHIAGVPTILQSSAAPLSVALHPQDLPIWRDNGYARSFGFNLDIGPDPTLQFHHQQILHLGSETLEVRHTPGHSLGHVVFYSAAANVLFSGDLIFQHSVGRTDLPGASQKILLHSIRTQIINLPPQTRLLSGHGPETTVAEEIVSNPYIN
jgi:hydroxyacylglutathione hydrolase